MVPVHGKQWKPTIKWKECNGIGGDRLKVERYFLRNILINSKVNFVMLQGTSKSFKK